MLLASARCSAVMTHAWCIQGREVLMQCCIGSDQLIEQTVACTVFFFTARVLAVANRGWLFPTTNLFA